MNGDPYIDPNDAPWTDEYWESHPHYEEDDTDDDYYYLVMYGKERLSP